MLEQTHKQEDAPTEIHQARWEMLEHLQALLNVPLILLSFVWLGLIILGFVRGLTPVLREISNGIWVIFVLDFGLEFWIAPHKGRYLRRNWLTAIALLLPALGTLRLLPLVRLLLTAHTAGYVSLLRVITSLNRGMRALRSILKNRGLGYAVALSGLVLLVGSAGMLAFENPTALHQAGFSDAETGGLNSYSDALWFTSMLMTTIGSGYSPVTSPGRILCWLLSLYSISIFTYITASVASHFVGQDREEGKKQ